MTALTKKMRQEILEKVVAATKIPKMKADLKKQTESACREYARSLLPADFVPKTKGLPKEWFRHVANIEFGENCDPTELMKPFDSRRNSWRTTVSIEPIAIPAHLEIKTIFQEKLVDGEIRNPIPAWLKPLLKEAESIFEKEHEFRMQMHNTLVSFTTVEKMLEQLPKLKRHVTVPEKSYPVAVDIKKISKAMSSIGFDTGE